MKLTSYPASGSGNSSVPSLNPIFCVLPGTPTCQTASRSAADGFCRSTMRGVPGQSVDTGLEFSPSSTWRNGNLGYFANLPSAFDKAPKDLQGSAIFDRARKCVGPTNTFDPHTGRTFDGATGNYYSIRIVSRTPVRRREPSGRIHAGGNDFSIGCASGCESIAFDYGTLPGGISCVVRVEST